MGLRQELIRVVREMGYTKPTPVQEQAIPEALEGRDLMCCAQTGTGKTAAFALPILQKLAAARRASLRTLVLVPTRELALQVDKYFYEYGKHLDLVSTTVYGGVPIGPQEMMLRRKPDVLIATPGRLIDHMWRGNIDFRNIEYLVLDEADRMLDMGFLEDVSEIIQALPARRQSMLFSATLDGEIKRFSKGILREPVKIEVAPPATTLDEVDQFRVKSSHNKKRSTLENLIKKYRMKRAIIFARTKSGVSRLASHLNDRGFRASAIHSDRSQSDRVRALESFRAGRTHLLVATDIAARGIDISDVSHVVNYDVPYSAEDYVHRIGRTARAGRRGMAISLVTPDDSRIIKAIENLITKKLSWLSTGDSKTDEETTSARSRSGRRRTRGRKARVQRVAGSTQAS